MRWFSSKQAVHIYASMFLLNLYFPLKGLKVDPLNFESQNHAKRQTGQWVSEL